MRRLIQTRFFNSSIGNAMPKKNTKNNKPSSATTASSSSSTEGKKPNANNLFLHKEGIIGIRLHVKPSAKISTFTDINDDGFGIQIAAPPVDGEANTEVIKYVSSVLGVKKSEVELDKGSKSRLKTLLVSSDKLTPALVLELIEKDIKN